MSHDNDDLRIKMELLEDEDTQHLYNSDSSEDVKPLVPLRPTPSVSGYIELSSDDEGPARPARKKRKKSTFFIRLVLKEVATQTDDVPEKKDASVTTDDVSKAETGVNTDEPPKTAEIGVDTTDIDTEKDKEDEDMDADDDEEPHQTPSSSKDIYYQCAICSCYYLSFNLLQKHSRTQHNKDITEQQKVSYQGNCKFCTSSYVFATYNKHIKTKHTEQFTVDGNIREKKRHLVGPYECSICNNKFLSYNDGKRHRRMHQDIDQKFVLRKLKTPNEAAGGATPVKEEVKKAPTTPLHRAPIPKNVLFQCPKCELNFFTYRNGLRHRIACDRGEKKGVEAKCTKCEKKFLQVHIRNHDFQHEMTEDFNVQEIVDGIEHKIMYRCVNCKVCMEERSCRLHFECGCDKTIGVPCTVCQLKVDKNFMSKHKDAHAHLGLTKEDVILVDICG